MANLTSPPIGFGGTDEPTNATYLVPIAQIAPASVIVYTGNILTTPAPLQLITEEEPPTAGYPIG